MSHNEQTHKHVRKARVLRDTVDKTTSVVIERYIKHPTQKYVKKQKKLLVHDEMQICKAGDWVNITETKPYSKRKTSMVISVIGAQDGEQS